MTIFALALAIAACIGWTTHTRVLRHALHEAWVETDAKEAERDAKEVHHCVADSALLTCGTARRGSDGELNYQRKDNRDISRSY